MPPFTLTLPIHRRYVPSSVEIHGAKVSAEVIALIVILITVTLFGSTLICYICIKRRQAKEIRLHKAREQAEKIKQLRPRINARNARFYAPGLGLGAGSTQMVEEGGSGTKGWKDGLKGKIDQSVLERWNRGEREYRSERGSGSIRGSLDKQRDFDVVEIEMQKFGHTKKPERAWVNWGRT